MRQELKFGGLIARGGKPESCASSTSSTSLTSSTSRVSSPRIAPFLIDTLAIRIARNSFDCITSVHSNRHSAGGFGGAPKLCWLAPGETANLSDVAQDARAII
jgi:hypothetical protein